MSTAAENVHKNTKKLHKLMKDYDLNAIEVAEMIGVQANTVRVWRIKTNLRVIPDTKLELLELKLSAIPKPEK